MINKRKKIQQLLALSTTRGKLDPRKVVFIAKKLNARELKEYYHQAIRKREEEKVTVTSPIDMPTSVALQFKQLFKDKDVFFLHDPKILAGIKVKFSDFVFDASFEDYINKLRKLYEIN